MDTNRIFTNLFSGWLAAADKAAVDFGTAPPPKRGALCETCRFFAGIPEEQSFETAGSPATQGVVLVV